MNPNDHYLQNLKKHGQSPTWEVGLKGEQEGLRPAGTIGSAHDLVRKFKLFDEHMKAWKAIEPDIRQRKRAMMRGCENSAKPCKTHPQKLLRYVRSSQQQCEIHATEV